MDLLGKQSVFWAQLQSVTAVKPAACGCGTALTCPPWSSAAFATSGLTQVKLSEGAGGDMLQLRCSCSRTPKPLAGLNLLQPKVELRLLQMQTNQQNQSSTIFWCKSIAVWMQKHIFRHEGCFQMPLLHFSRGDCLADISLKSPELKSRC